MTSTATKPKARRRRWLLVTVTTLAGCQPATAPDDTTGGSRVEAEVSAPTREQATRFVEGLDKAFNAHRFEDYFGQFDLKEHPQFDAALRSFVRQMQKTEKSAATSRIKDFFTRGGLGVAHVVTTYRCPATSCEIITALALRRVGDRTRGIFALEMDAPRFSALSSARDTFSCGACNYQITFDDSWLAVPVPSERSGCMESLWLVSLTHDVHLEVAVQVGETQVAAKDAMRHCLEIARKRGQCTSDTPLRIETWQAPGWSIAASESTATTPHFTGCRSQQRCPAGRDAELYLLTSGRVRYMLVARGPAAQLADHRKAIDGVLASFRPIESEVGKMDLVQKVIYAHTGASSVSEDNRFVNRKHMISLSGPRGWTSKLMPGRFEFELSFTCPNNAGHLRVIAKQQAGGWTRAAVEAVASRIPLKDGRAVQKTRPWRELATDGFSVLDLWTAARPDGDPDHIRRFAFHGKLLLIMDGTIPDRATQREIEACLASLQVDD